MKLAFISDVHIGPSAYHNGVRRKLTEYSEQFINEFTGHVRTSDDNRFAIHLGDLIQDADPETDLKNFRTGIELFTKCTIPLHHLVGNHDTVNIPADKIRRMLNLDSLYYAFDEEEYHFIILYSQVPVPARKISIIPEEQLKWLESDLNATIKPTVIFMHHSLADQDLTGNPWFEGRPEACLVANRAEVRHVLAASGKIAAVVNSHLHWNRLDYHDGIPYITVQSPIENFKDDGTPANAWGEIELSMQRFTLEVHGNDKARYEHTFGL